MSKTVCLVVDTLSDPGGGGHRWVYLNWAPGLEALGFEVLWREWAAPDSPAAVIGPLRAHVKPYGLGDCVRLVSSGDRNRSVDGVPGARDPDEVADAELHLNLRHSPPAEAVRRLRRSARVDIDPGLLRIWMASGQIEAAPHSVHFTTDETVGPAGCAPTGLLDRALGSARRRLT